MPGTKHFNLQKAALFWLMTISYMGIIFFLSSQHGFKLPDLPKNIDKIVHMLAYVPLAFLFYLSLRTSGINKYLFLVSVLCAIAYGISDELHQSFVPGRVSAFGDIAADSIGAILGSLGASFIKN